MASTPLTASVAAAVTDTMRVHFIDVGQGDATLLEFPCGAVLIDTGGEKNGEVDSTEELDVYLDEFFLRRQDLGRHLTSLVLTHPHIDHTRGVKMVLEGYTPRNIVTNGQEHGSGGAQQRRAHRFVADAELTPATDDDIGFVAVALDEIPAAGLTGPVIDPVDCGAAGDPKLMALWGRVSSDPGWGSEHGKLHFDDPNNHSLVLRVDFGQASILLTGDLETVAIDDLVQRYRTGSLLDVDVYQVGHHGSANGTTTGLVQAMSPELAVLSMGPFDRETTWTAWAYGHPRKPVVDHLEKGVSGSRPSVTVKVATGVQRFVDHRLTKAIYATGWNGTVVFEGRLDGSWTVVTPHEGSSPININTAGVAELVALPGIGPVKAQRILDYRDDHGDFTSVDQLLNVNGIGPATLEGIRSLIRL